MNESGHLDPKEPKEKTSEGIRKLLEGSGYPTEIDVASILRKDGWLVFSQYPYMDENERKFKLIDVAAFKPVSRSRLASVVIECKKSSKHGWAFHTIPKRGELQSTIAMMTSLAMKFDSLPEALLTLPPQEEGVFPRQFHVTRFETKIGTLCFIPPNHPDDFHEALHQTVSALGHLQQNMKNCVFFPIIVFDGPMWEFYKEDGKLEIKETEYLQYLAPLAIESEELLVLIDIVTSNTFSRLLELINGSLDYLVRAEELLKPK